MTSQIYYTSDLWWCKILCFTIGYFAIIFEHNIRINKATSALLMAISLWVLQFSGSIPLSQSLSSFNEHLASISQIVLFLFGALAIVEQVHAHGGLSLVSRFLNTSSGLKTTCLISCITFFLSSILDNLTTTIVMVMLLRKCVEDLELRLIFGGIVVIAANAGGAWTPIGDVTTTMLWIGQKLSTSYIITSLFLPSVACLVVALSVLFRHIPRTVEPYQDIEDLKPHGMLVLLFGFLSLLFVPIFKFVTGLPPFMGILFGVSVMWVLTDLLHRNHKDRESLRITHAFSHVDMSSILFFLGILLAVSALEDAGILKTWAANLNEIFPSREIMAFVIGLFSAVIDNVPLVAASMGMYDYPIDNPFWSLIAYCAGTGGSILVIGSAAGVAFMGLENVNFFWYLKRIALPAFLGYVAGILVWILQTMLA